jgi:enoyl-CoA hydratase/carnithine racemase
VAALHGVAVGAGAVIALASDFRIASERVRIGFVFSKVGLCGADMGAATLLPRVVGLGRASELLFFGDLVDAPVALAMGLVHRVVAHDACLSTAKEWAERLAQGPAFAHGITKRMLENEHTMALEVALEAEAQAQAICMMHPDFRAFYEGWRAKEPPRFRGAPPVAATAGKESVGP